MKYKVYRNFRIRYDVGTHYSEIRELEGGHSTRGTGQWTTSYYEMYKVNGKEFNEIKQAKRYIDSLYNYKSILKLRNKCKKIEKSKKDLDKQLKIIEKQLYKLGV